MSVKYLKMHYEYIMEYFVSPFVLSEVLFSQCELKVMAEVMAGLGLPVL